MMRPSCRSRMIGSATVTHCGRDHRRVAKDGDQIALTMRLYPRYAEQFSSSFAALAKRQGVSPSYFTRLVRLSYLAPDITEAILDGRQPPDLTADKLLAHSRLPLGWHEQRTVLGFA